ncbi:MAG: hypothetical protein H7Y86_10935 [Rhizobacter sp.]|nr:hypothetical protein [Ferruginibacter sp.]
MKLTIGFLIMLMLLIISCKNKKHDTRDIATTELSSGQSDYDSTVFEPIYKKLRSGEALSANEIAHFADSIATRSDFYHLLSEFNKQSLFPEKYNSFEKATESVMAGWLMYPTELDTIPSKIELVKVVSHPENDTAFIYYAYRFKTDEPHWAAKDGWMLGVVGPYLKNSHPYDWVNGTFSRFTKAAETTPEKEVKWIHDSVYRRSPQ